MKGVYLLFLTILFVNFMTIVCGQPVNYTVDSSRLFSKVDSLIELKKDESKSSLDVLNKIPEINESFISERDKSIKSEYAYHIAYVDYQLSVLSHRQRMFSYQYYSKIAIFILVIIIVLSGLAMSAIQFMQTTVAGRVETEPVKSADPATQAIPLPAVSQQTMNELEVSLTSFKIKSSVIGLLILMISVIFFYLYLYLVHPLIERNTVNLPTTEVGPPTAK